MFTKESYQALLTNTNILYRFVCEKVGSQTLSKQMSGNFCFHLSSMYRLRIKGHFEHDIEPLCSIIYNTLLKNNVDAPLTNQEYYQRLKQNFPMYGTT